MTIESTPSTPFIILTENQYGCGLGEVSAIAYGLGAKLLVIPSTIEEDLTNIYNRIDYTGALTTVPTVVVHPDFASLASSYFPTNEIRFEVDYSFE